MKHIISRLMDMASENRFSTKLDEEISQSLRSLVMFAEDIGWSASIDDVVIDGLSGMEFSTAMFEVASCLEDRGDVSSLFLGYILRGLAQDQDLSETKCVPTSMMWIPNDSDHIIRYSDSTMIRSYGACECPNCRAAIDCNEMWRIDYGIICESCGAKVKTSGIAVRISAELPDGV